MKLSQTDDWVSLTNLTRTGPTSAKRAAIRERDRIEWIKICKRKSAGIRTSATFASNYTRPHAFFTWLYMKILWASKGPDMNIAKSESEKGFLCPFHFHENYPEYLSHSLSLNVNHLSVPCFDNKVNSSVTKTSCRLNESQHKFSFEKLKNFSSTAPFITEFMTFLQSFSSYGDRKRRIHKCFTSHTKGDLSCFTFCR